MTIDDQIKAEKLQRDVNKLQKYQLYHQAKLIIKNIIQMKKYHLLIKNK